MGFFYYCIRLGWINENPAVRLGRIKADGPPTDYFPKEEFDAIIDATYIYQPKGWTACRNQPTAHGRKGMVAIANETVWRIADRNRGTALPS